MESKSLCLRDDFRFFTPLCYVQNDRMSTLPRPSLHLKPDSGRPRRPGPASIRASEGLRAPVAMVVSPRPERAGQADQDGRPSGAARAAIDLSVVRGVGSSTIVRGSVGSYRPVIAGAKLRRVQPRSCQEGESTPGSRLVFNALSPHWRGTRRRQRRTSSMVHGENRIPYWIEQSLTGLAGPDYDATISFGLPFELGDCPYGKSR